MAVKLFVGNLSFDVLENDITDLFSKAGTVTSVNILQDKFTGKGRGFGFVEMSNETETKNAISMFDGKQFQGRALKVNEARPREQRPPGAGGEGRSGGGSGYRQRH
jgi:cold-inducible RNA-binding protein